MSALNDLLEQELGSLVDTILERVHDDDGSAPLTMGGTGSSHRRGNAVRWTMIDPHGARYTLHGLYEAIPAKRRQPAIIALERVRMIMPGKFNASYHFDSWRLSDYGSLKVHGFYPRLELARFVLMVAGSAPVLRDQMRDALNKDADPDAVLILSGL